MATRRHVVDHTPSRIVTGGGDASDRLPCHPMLVAGPPNVGRSGAGAIKIRFGRLPVRVWRVSASRFIVRRLGLLFGSTASVLAIVGAFVLPAASADRVLRGCTIVDHPTPHHHTKCRGADFSRTNFSGINLSYADLAHANLTHANLTSANLTHATLLRAALGHAILSHADLDGANLTRADLTNATNT